MFRKIVNRKAASNDADDSLYGAPSDIRDSRPYKVFKFCWFWLVHQPLLIAGFVGGVWLGTALDNTLFCIGGPQIIQVIQP